MKIQSYLLITLVLVTVAPFADAADHSDILIADFEDDSYGAWKVEGEAFGDRPAVANVSPLNKVAGHEGKGLVNSFLGGDAPVGRLTSPPFTIERAHINFLIGGGNHTGKTCMNLLVDGKVVRSAVGPAAKNRERQELIDRLGWDVSEFRGKEAVLEIVDAHSGGWGHVNVDHILQSDDAVENPADAVWTREIAITGRYLLLPVKNGGRPPFVSEQNSTMQILDVFVGETLVHSPSIYLAHQKDEVDWWANLDMSEFVGKTATLRLRLTGRAAVPHMPADSKALELIETSNEMRNLQPLYDESIRPQFHFSQKRGWSGDCNGMVHYDGEYHFFWQSNPVGLVWENMYWGHAVSPDMIHWRELRPALRPNGQGPDGKAVANRHPAMAVGHCHSGGGNVDHNNSGGFQPGEHKTLILTYTDTGEGRQRTFDNFGEAIAYSTDRGRTWRNYAGNPIFRHPVGRDPKLFWYEPGRHWTIGVYDEGRKGRDGGGIAFYTSDDLKRWERTSRIDGFFECPEIFERPVEPLPEGKRATGGDPKNKKWVMFAADAKYIVGRFDGKRFTPEHEGKHRLVHGPVYAGQCFSNPPDGRTVFMGRCILQQGDAPFCNGFTLPLNLTLHSTPKGVRMRGYPIRELDALHDGELFAVEDQTLTAGDGAISFETDRKTADIHVTVRPAPGAETVKLRFSDGEVVYDVPKGALRGCEKDDAWNRTDGRVTLRVLIDRPMVEVFLNRGETYLLQRRSGKPLGKVALETEGVVEEFRAFGMKSIWKKEGERHEKTEARVSHAGAGNPDGDTPCRSGGKPEHHPVHDR